MIAGRLAAVAFMALSCATSYAGDGARIAEGVRSGLLWETRWYGQAFGQRCLHKAMDRGGIIRGLIKPLERTVGFSCSSGEAKRQVVQAFEATVDGAGIFLSGEVTPALRAEISDGEDNPDCSLIEDDLRRRTTELKRAGVSVPLKALTDSGTENEPSPALRSFAVRTIALWARKEKLPKPRSIHIGPVGSNDPFLVVGIGDRILLIRSPDEVEAASPDFCGVVFSPHRFAGRQAEKALRSDELSRLRRRLTEVGGEISVR